MSVLTIQARFGDRLDVCKFTKLDRVLKGVNNGLTLATESRAAIAKMSAQDTDMLGHVSTTLCLACAMTSKPLAELSLGGEVCSPWNDPGISSRRIPPSQPCF